MFKYLDNMDCLALLSSILLAVFMLRLHYYKAAKYVRNVLVSQYVILAFVLYCFCYVMMQLILSLKNLR